MYSILHTQVHANTDFVCICVHIHICVIYNNILCLTLVLSLCISDYLIMTALFLTIYLCQWLYVVCEQFPGGIIQNHAHDPGEQ